MNNARLLSATSRSAASPFMAIQKPPILAKGIRYSSRVGSNATARGENGHEWRAHVGSSSRKPGGERLGGRSGNDSATIAQFPPCNTATSGALSWGAETEGVPHPPSPATIPSQRFDSKPFDRNLLSRPFRRKRPERPLLAYLTVFSCFRTFVRPESFPASAASRRLPRVSRDSPRVPHGGGSGRRTA